MKNKYENEECESCDEDEDIDMSMMLPLMLSGMGQSRDPLMENGVIFLNGAVTEKTADRLIHQLWAYHFAEEYTDPINLIINSPGGRADYMWAVIDTMHAIKNEVHTIGIGDISSAGFLIFVAGDHRTASQNAVFMLHNYHGGVAGNHPDLLAARKGQDLEYKRGIDHLLSNSKYKSEKQIKEHLLKDQDHYISAKEMAEHGLCEHVFPVKRRRKKK